MSFYLQVNPDKIAAYVGGFDSDTSMKMADVLGSLGIPQISYGATSVTLKDTMRYTAELLLFIIISPDESRGYIGFRSVAPPPPPPPPPPP